MNYPKYQLKAERNLTTFEFVSVGRKGNIKKVVLFRETNLKGVFNLGFGDKNEATNDVDDLAISDNGDSEKVLATVASTVYAFYTKFPDALIYIVGSTPTRTRLYQIGISKNLPEISDDFYIYGQINEDDWEDFTVNKNYLAFLIQKK